jgi:hypothetical protein
LILDADLASIYGVTTARLNQQVRRNHDRFPADFAYQLTQQEVAVLMLQNATSSSGHGGRRKPPHVFTEYGAVMAANVLNTPVAINASILVVRAFVRMREIVSSHADLARKIDDMERKIRRAIQGSLRRHSATHGSAAEPAAANRISREAGAMRIRGR